MKIIVSELVLNLLEEVQQNVCGDVQELHIHDTGYCNFIVVKDSKKVTVSIKVQGENEDE